MNEETKKQLQAAIAACAIKIEKADTGLDAMQYAQAALNAANALACLHLNVKE